MAEMVITSFFWEVMASRDRTAYQLEGSPDLAVGERLWKHMTRNKNDLMASCLMRDDSEESAVWSNAFGFPAFHNYGLICVVSLCLCVLLLLNVLRRHRYFSGSVRVKTIKFNFLMYVFGVERLGV